MSFPIQRTLPPIDCGESVIQRYHAQNIQATFEEFKLMLVDGLTPAERRSKKSTYITADGCEVVDDGAEDQDAT